MTPSLVLGLNTSDFNDPKKPASGPIENENAAREKQTAANTSTAIVLFIVPTS